MNRKARAGNKTGLSAAGCTCRRLGLHRSPVRRPGLQHRRHQRTTARAQRIQARRRHKVQPAEALRPLGRAEADLLQRTGERGLHHLRIALRVRCGAAGVASMLRKARVVQVWFIALTGGQRVSAAADKSICPSTWVSREPCATLARGQCSRHSCDSPALAAVCAIWYLAVTRVCCRIFRRAALRQWCWRTSKCKEDEIDLAWRLHNEPGCKRGESRRGAQVPNPQAVLRGATPQVRVVPAPHIARRRIRGVISEENKRVGRSVAVVLTSNLSQAQACAHTQKVLLSSCNIHALFMRQHVVHPNL